MSLARTVTLGNKTIDVPVTAVDQLVNFFSPSLGADRFQSRLRMAITGGYGYTGADRTRRANQSGSRREMDADSAILRDLRILRQESQHLVRNNAIAGGAIKTNVTKVVGTGLKVKSQLDREVLNLTDEQADTWERSAEREYRLATETREIDSERQLPFSLLQGLAFLKVLEDGDVLVNLPRFKRPGSPYSLKIQLIESARLCNKDNLPDTPHLSGGVEKDDTGAPVAYQVLNQHPGNFRVYDPKNFSWTTLPAFGKNTGSPLAMLLLDKARPGQTRGVPYLAPVVELIKQLGRYTDAEVMAAVVSGMLTVFVTNETGDPVIGPSTTMTNPTGDPSTQVDTTGLELGYGSVVGLMPGEKVETVNPGRPNTAFDPFVQAILRQIGVALELPFELLIKHFTASYSAARAALEEAWDYFNRRRHWLVTVLCQPVYEAVITEAVATGRLKAPGFFSDPLIRRAWLSTSWTGDAPSQLDPKKEIDAAKARVELGISTRSEECARLTGGDWEAKQPQIEKEVTFMRKIGPTVERFPATVPAPPPDNTGGSDLEGTDNATD
ncbi:MAG: phage portal protein [Deltaproteobacteria bacterium]|nr:phage portal protein [Deltaproteobacteria bacterium]